MVMTQIKKLLEEAEFEISEMERATECGLNEELLMVLLKHDSMERDYYLKVVTKNQSYCNLFFSNNEQAVQYVVYFFVELPETILAIQGNEIASLLHYLNLFQNQIPVCVFQ